jgi:hypothetical protein
MSIFIFGSFSSVVSSASTLLVRRLLRKHKHTHTHNKRQQHDGVRLLGPLNFS